jgi:uncharacterized protein (DUF433 family)
MEWQKYLTSDDTIPLGKPTIKGTRISMEHIIGLLALGWTEQQTLEKKKIRLTQKSLQAVFTYIQECLKEGLLFSNA